MKKYLLPILLLAISFPLLPARAATKNPVSASVYTAWGDVWGVEFDGKNLWTGTPNGQLFKMDTKGNILAGYDIGASNTGLALAGKYIWYSTQKGLYKLDLKGNKILSDDFSDLPDFITGLAWDGRDLWAIDRGNQSLIKLNNKGKIAQTIPVPGGWALLDGLEWDGANFWMADAQTRTLIKFSKRGKVLATYQLPGANATDLAYDKGSFWIADIDDNVIRKINPRYLPKGLTTGR